MHNIKGDNSKCIFFLELCPFFNLHFQSGIKDPTAEHWHQHMVLLFFVSVEKHCGKRKNAADQQFLLYLQCF